MSSELEAELERRLKAQYEPAKAEKRSYSPAPTSGPASLHPTEKALRDAVWQWLRSKAGVALVALVVGGGSGFAGKTHHEAAQALALKAVQERQEAQQKAIDSLTTELPVLREATLGATGRSKRVASVQRAQAEWLCSYLRMFEGIGCLVDGAPKEPPLLTLGTAPLGPGEPLVIRPPTRIIETPVPAGEAEPDRAPRP